MFQFLYRRLSTRFIAVLVVGILQGATAMSIHASSPPLPSIDFEAMLDTRMYPSGMLGIGASGYSLVFAPQGSPVDAGVEVVSASAGAVAMHRFRPEFRVTHLAFGMMQLDGPGDVQLPSAGAYELRFHVSGRVASVLPFEAHRSSGDDPFAPQATWSYSGPWERWGYLIGTDYRDLKSGADIKAVNLVWWTGQRDLAAGTTRAEPAAAELYRDGTMVAHSRRNTMSIHPEHYRRERPWTLFRPHAEKDSNVAHALSTQELLGSPGTYELRVKRVKDAAVVRRFRFTVQDNKVVPHPRTVLGHQPATQYIAPRVIKKGSNVYEFTEAIWIESTR